MKEIRASRTSNQVQYFLLNQAFGDPETISSSEELVASATSFFSANFCLGLQYDGLLNDVKTISTGYKNSLNC